MNTRNGINLAPELGDIVQFKDVRMDGTINYKHMGMIYLIERGSAFIEWFDGKKPYNYSDRYGYSTIKIQQEYDVFSIVAKASDAKPR